MWFNNLYTIAGTGTGIIAVANGGTGLGTIPTAGQLLIGNGTGYTLNTLGYGAGISVTNSAGAISIANTGVLSNIAGTGISVSGATGNVTIANTGVLSFSSGTTGLTPATATTGAIVLNGTLTAANGGTGFGSYAVGDLLYANTTTTLAKLTDVAAGNALLSNGPTWGKIGLTTHVSGVLPIANGGTNTTASPTLGGVVYGTGTAQAYSATGSSGQFLTSAGGAAPTWTSASALAGAIGYYGAYHDTSTATATSTTVAYVMNIGSVDIQNGVSIVGGTKITAANAGTYNLQFSAQFSNPNAAIADISVWIRLNGTNVTDGAGTNGVPAKHGSNNGLQIVSWNYVLSLAAADYIELVWHSDLTGVQLITIPATTSPAVPESPALIVTVQALSQIGIGYYGQTSTTSTTIGTGSKTFTVSIPATSTAFTIGTRVRFAYTTTPINYMEGVITAFSNSTMTVLMDLTGGSGTYATWAISVAGDQGVGFVALTAPQTKTADFAVATTDTWLINNKTGSTCTVTLPAAASYPGRELTFQNYQAQTLVSASSNVVPRGGGSAGTAILLGVVGNWATLVSDSTNWIIMQAAANNCLLLE
jgi:hypothetical protein